MKFNYISYILSSSVTFINAIQFKRIYGVAEKDLGKYQMTPDGNFHCLDGTQVIPYSALNDDYCDCKDGSDEPGTSACQNGKFFCDNIGSVGHYIPSSRVNDGVCDYDLCCDGSDEYNGTIKCPDRCEEMARKLESERNEKLMYMFHSFQNRQLMIMRAMANITRDAQELELKKQKYEKEKENFENLKAEVKELEQIEKDTKDLYKSLYRELKIEFNDNKNKLKKAIEDILKIKNSNNINKSIINNILEEYNENLLAQFEKGIIKKDENEESSSPEEIIDEDEEEEKRKYSEKEAAYKEIKSKLSKLRIERNEVDRTTKDYKRDMEALKKRIEMDNGKNHVFYTLYNEVFSLNTTDYIYTFTWGNEIKQKQIGGAMTLLGKFKEYKDNYKTIIYDNGAQCWKGPKRSVTVKLICGPENKILKISEPSKCEYLLEFSSPGSCDDNDFKIISIKHFKESGSDDAEFSEDILNSIKDIINESPEEPILDEEEIDKLDEKEQGQKHDEL
ncbi:hypothetical protein BCR36DRAFT_402194 [Piromyces finnis]|uniref:Glucosidase 2 subunit beta n=1 Tax=Piromyces finnis TaxID=1754191 RepID=A0A1Y1VJA2_9FUNG|nr:hypothetical protein BCR36DRAFT_402194 [Piromyces finnis]|eukprot:ORX57790.1 hypothetical protein BCR36DRAFT_402194 [Piromyces finnis]